MSKVCLITGAAKGIGKATLLHFLEKDYFCIGIDKDNEAVDRLTAQLTEKERKRVLFEIMDLTKDIETHKWSDSFSKLRKSKPLQLTLINNIGGSIQSRKPFEESTWEEFHDTLLFNLKPLHTMTRILLPIMKKNQFGRIVNVSSVSARIPLENVGAEYPAAKSAIIAISRHLAAQVIKDGILVNTICPGIIGTERMLTRWANRDPKINQSVLKTIPINRLGTPEEVAKAIYFLGSNTNTYITGAILDVNGGMYLP